MFGTEGTLKTLFDKLKAVKGYTAGKGMPPGYLELGYQQGGRVQGGDTTPTIANYFGRQGVSLGGSYKQSLSEILGRR